MAAPKAVDDIAYAAFGWRGKPLFKLIHYPSAATRAMPARFTPTRKKSRTQGGAALTASMALVNRQIIACLVRRVNSSLDIHW